MDDLLDAAAERAKATALIKEVFPDAKVTSEANHASKVQIESQGVKIVEVAQRDLYRKYKWPAAPNIKQHLEIFKEEYHEN